MQPAHKVKIGQLLAVPDYSGGGVLGPGAQRALHGPLLTARTVESRNDRPGPCSRDCPGQHLMRGRCGTEAGGAGGVGLCASGWGPTTREQHR